MKKTIITSALLLLNFWISANAQSIQEARKLTDNEQFEAATAMYQSLLAKTPNDASVYYYFGNNLLLADNPDSAKALFEKGSEAASANPFLKIGKAKLLLSQISVREAKAAKDKDAANPELKIRLETAETNLRDANALIDEATLSATDINIFIESAEAYIHYKNKNTDKAKSLLDKAAAIDAKNIEVNLLYGDLYSELNNGTLAADYYNRALDLNKSSARAIVSKGRLYKRSTNYQGAADEFQNAIKLEPAYAPSYRELGEVYIKLNQLAKAKEAYKKYLELSSNNCSARVRYATFLYLSKDYTGALSEIAQVQQRCDSNNITMLRVQSYSYYETKEYEKGLEVVNHLFRLLSQDKRTSIDYEYYGKLLIATNQDSLGLENLQLALSLDPANTELLSDMAAGWVKLKQYPNAIELYKQRMVVNKNIKVMDYYQLGRAYYYNRQFTEADSAVAKAITMSPNWASAWILRAQINANIDSTSEAGEARPYYEKYIEIALADSANSAKYKNGLSESYGYFASYFFLVEKKNALAVEYLKKKLQLQLEAEEIKQIQLQIDQIEHPQKAQPKK